MTLSWHADQAWSRRFLPSMKRIIGEHLIGDAPQEEDAQHNTDLIVLKLDAVRIACRIRRFSYYHNFSSEFTIRSGRPSGVKTELAKIIEGWGDYLLYGFCDQKEEELYSWILGDLKVFRLWLMRYMVGSGIMPGEEMCNDDNSSLFRAFFIADLPSDFVIASHPPRLNRLPLG